MARMVHSWSLTLGAMRDQGCVAKALCDRCHVEHLIDAAALAEKVGDDFSLWNRRCRCRLTEGREGWVSFFYQVHSGFVPMRTHAWDMRLYGVPPEPLSEGAQRILGAMLSRR